MKSKLSKKISFATFLFFASVSSSYAFAYPQWVECTFDCAAIFGEEFFWDCADFCLVLFPAP